MIKSKIKRLVIFLSGQVNHLKKTVNVKKNGMVTIMVDFIYALNS